MKKNYPPNPYDITGNATEINKNFTAEIKDIERRQDAMRRLWSDMRTAQRRLYLILISELLGKGDTTVALMLDKIAYWHYPDQKGKRKLQVRRDDKYWSVITADNWYYELGLSVEQVKQANKKLKNVMWNGEPLVIMLNSKTGRMRGMHYRLNWSVFAHAFYHFLEKIEDMEKNASYKHQKKLWERSEYYQEKKKQATENQEEPEEENEGEKSPSIAELRGKNPLDDGEKQPIDENLRGNNPPDVNNFVDNEGEKSPSIAETRGKNPLADGENSQTLNYNHHLQPTHQPTLGGSQFSPLQPAASALKIGFGGGSPSNAALTTNALPPEPNDIVQYNNVNSGLDSSEVQSRAGKLDMQTSKIFKGELGAKLENSNISTDEQYLRGMSDKDFKKLMEDLTK